MGRAIYGVVNDLDDVVRRQLTRKIVERER
jgi:hypothetical protein